MIKKIEYSVGNISQGVEFLLKGAKKRRSTAIASAAALNADLSVYNTKLVALK